jgi:4-amino-4-deoxy-L-arabinose transferase-like glycosyltransferase
MLGMHTGSIGIATNYVDPVTKIQAQDEAVYASSSIHMASDGNWLTPQFLGRYALYKPPLLYWLSAASMKIAGFSTAALRAPSIVSGALTIALLFAWIWSARSLAAALSSALLLMSNREFFTLSRTATMDSLLLLWTVAAVLVLARDPAM